MQNLTDFVAEKGLNPAEKKALQQQSHKDNLKTMLATTSKIGGYAAAAAQAVRFIDNLLEV